MLAGYLLQESFHSGRCLVTSNVNIIGKFGAMMDEFNCSLYALNTHLHSLTLDLTLLIVSMVKKVLKRHGSEGYTFKRHVCACSTFTSVST